jgi:hypothetical protein
VSALGGPRVDNRHQSDSPHFVLEQRDVERMMDVLQRTVPVPVFRIIVHRAQQTITSDSSDSRAYRIGPKLELLRELSPPVADLQLRQDSQLGAFESECVSCGVCKDFPATTLPAQFRHHPFLV